MSAEFVDGVSLLLPVASTCVLHSAFKVGNGYKNPCVQKQLVTLERNFSINSFPASEKGVEDTNNLAIHIESHTHSY